MKLLTKLRSLFERRKLEADMAEEMRLHLEARVAEHVAAGLSPEQARHAARRQFGGAEQVKEAVREQRSFVWLEQLRQDVQYALRQLGRAKSFTFVVVLTLALGIGATTAIYSVIHTVLFNPLPNANADRIVRLGQNYLGLENKLVPRDFLWSGFEAISGAEGPFEELAWLDGESSRAFERREGEFVTSVAGCFVSPNFFRLLGVPPALGRSFADEDAVAIDFDTRQPSRDPAMVLSHRGWQTLFSGDKAVLGRAMEFGGHRYTVIGVMPEWFRFPNESIEFWVATKPMQVPAGRLTAANLMVLARTKPGVEIAAAQAFLEVVARRLSDDPQVKPLIQLARTPAGFSVWTLPLRDTLLGGGGGIGAGNPKGVTELRHTLFSLLAAIGFVLLIVCANIANLILARTERRQHELSIRAALGAGRGRIMRQLFTENALLALLGGVGGLIVTRWGMQLLTSFSTLPRLRPIEIDGEVLGSALLIATVTTLAFGLIPAWRGGKPRLNEALAQGGSGSTVATSGRAYRNALVVVQVALAVVLLASAGLMIQSVVRILRVDPGYKAENLIGVIATPPMRIFRMGVPAAVRHAFDEQLRERFASIPGVTAAGLWRPGGYEEPILVDGADEPVKVYRGGIGIGEADGFRVANTPLLGGRLLEPRDVGSGIGTVVVNEAMARLCWPGESAVGKRFRLKQVRTKEDAEFYEVVGVVGDMLEGSYNERLMPSFFRPHQDEANKTGFTTRILVRTASDPTLIIPALRHEISQAEPSLRVPSLWTVTQRLFDSTQAQRTYRNYLIALAGVGLLLAALGIYGVLAYAVARRTREIGIRIAIGASSRQVLSLVMGEGLRLIALGALAGLVAAFWLTRLLESRLFEVSSHDPAVALAVLGVLALVAGIACWLPARRATRIDPMAALRAE